MEDCITLVYAGSATGAMPLRRIAHEAGWRLTKCSNWRRALKLAVRLHATVFIYDRDANPREWLEALRQTVDVSPAPTFLMTSRIADETMWAELLVGSGYDLLLTPLEPAEVLRTIGAAHAYHMRVVTSGAALQSCTGRPRPAL